MPIAAEELRGAADDMVRLVRAEVVLVVPGNIVAILGICGPCKHLAIMPKVLRPGIDELKVSGGFYADVHPGVMGFIRAGAVVPEGARTKAGLVRRQVNLQPPGRAGEKVQYPDDAACAAVGIAPNQIID